MEEKAHIQSEWRQVASAKSSMQSEKIQIEDTKARHERDEVELKGDLTGSGNNLMIERLECGHKLMTKQGN